MLYLIKSRKGDIKIGHVRVSKSLKSRIDSYNSIEPLVELLDSCEGTEYLERRLHNILFFKGLNIHGEWFKNNPIIYKIWEMAKNKKWKPKYLKYVDTNLRKNPSKYSEDTPYDMYLYDFRQVDSECRPLWDGNYVIQFLRNLMYSLEKRNKRFEREMKGL